MDIEIGGLGPLQWDRLLANGLVTLDGDLTLSLRDGFVPSLIDPLLSIVTSNTGINGTFTNVVNPVNMPTGLRYQVVYEPLGVKLKVVNAQLVPADFNDDGLLDCLDVDALVAAIASGSQNVLFDLTGDGLINGGDLTQWLADAGAVNLPTGNSYLYGDANLDGAVDGSDFNVWNGNKFTAPAAWCKGDFNADGFVDGSDFNTWNSHKFSSADAMGQVPEPAVGWIAVVMLCTFLTHHRARNGSLHRFTDCDFS